MTSFALPPLPQDLARSVAHLMWAQAWGSRPKPQDAEHFLEHWRSQIMEEVKRVAPEYATR